MPRYRTSETRIVVGHEVVLEPTKVEPSRSCRLPPVVFEPNRWYLVAMGAGLFVSSVYNNVCHYQYSDQPELKAWRLWGKRCGL